MKTEWTSYDEERSRMNLIRAKCALIELVNVTSSPEIKKSSFIAIEAIDSLLKTYQPERLNEKT
jgi:hypothetical protein